MFTDLQLKIVGAVADVLFGNDNNQGARNYKRDPSLEEAQYGANIYPKPGRLTYYRISCATIFDNEFLTLEKVNYNEQFETFEEVELIGFVKLGGKRWDKYNLPKYAAAIEAMIERGC